MSTCLIYNVTSKLGRASEAREDIKYEATRIIRRNLAFQNCLGLSHSHGRPDCNIKVTGRGRGDHRTFLKALKCVVLCLDLK